MQSLRHQLFARATLARYQRCRRRCRQSFDQVTQKLGGLAVTNDLGFGTDFHLLHKLRTWAVGRTIGMSKARTGTARCANHKNDKVKNLALTL
jgi:hypothetical protein